MRIATESEPRLYGFDAPLVAFDRIELAEANRCLLAWKHEQGPLCRPPEYGFWAHALCVLGEPVAVVTASTLIRQYVGGGLRHLSRANAIEVSRLCAARPGLCLVALRLWRETVYPHLGFPVAVSYCRADKAGAVYRLDGWRCAQAQNGRPLVLSSGSDQRTGARGLRRHVWTWPPEAWRAPAGVELPAPDRRQQREPVPDLFATAPSRG